MRWWAEGESVVAAADRLQADTLSVSTQKNSLIADSNLYIRKNYQRYKFWTDILKKNYIICKFESVASEYIREFFWVYANSELPTLLYIGGLPL